MNISNTSLETGISKRTIRFYEEKGLITPKRNGKNNYREFCERQILELKIIKMLRLSGLSIEKIAEIKFSEGLESEKVINILKKELKKTNKLLRTIEDLLELY